MTPYATQLIPERDQELFRTIVLAIQNLPDEIRDRQGNRIGITCHKLARAVGSAFRLEHVDGYFVLPSHPHSWVKAPSGNVIDVYPVGMANGPLLADSNNCYVFLNMYVPLPTAAVSKGSFGKPEFRHHVAVLANQLKNPPRLPL